jgi:hypothetical protein
LPLGKDGKMETEEKEARELIERLKKLGLNDATIGEMVDEIEHLRAKTDSGATVPCSDGLANLIIWVDKLQDTAEQNMKKYKAQEQQFYGEKLACLKFKRKLMELMVG